MKKLIISTVGTSILTNIESANRKLLNNNSNCKEIECAKDLIEHVNELKIAASSKLESLKNVNELKRLSAELNSLYCIFDKYQNDKEDIHFLISTDTYQGKICGEILKNHLEFNGINAQIETPSSFNTRTKDSFDEGIKNLITWCENIIPAYKNAGYQIIFNLTGSFKSMIGYMNTIAMFYADKITYIFESTQADLIEIPKLPIELNTSNFSSFADKLALASLGYNFQLGEISELPELLFDNIENKAFFSVWGELIWSKVKKELLSYKLVNFPKVKYSETLKKLFKDASKEDKINFQETIAKISKLLLENDGNLSCLKADGGLQYEDIKNKYDNGKPIGHIRISQSERISCTYENGQILIRKFGRHDFINNDP